MNTRLLFILCLTTAVLPSDMIGDGLWFKRLERPNHRAGGALSQDGIQQLYQEYARKGLDGPGFTDQQRRDQLLKALWAVGSPQRHLFRVVRTYGQDNQRPTNDADGYAQAAIFRKYGELSQAQRDKIRPIEGGKVGDFLEHRARASYRRNVPFIARLFRQPKRRHLIGLGLSGLALGVGKVLFDHLEGKLSEMHGKRVAAQHEVLQMFGHANHKRLRQLSKSDSLLATQKKAIDYYFAVNKKYNTLTLQWLAALATFTAGSLGTAGSLFAHVRRDPVNHWREEAEQYIPQVAQ